LGIEIVGKCNRLECDPATGMRATPPPARDSRRQLHCGGVDAIINFRSTDVSERWQEAGEEGMKVVGDPVEKFVGSPEEYGDIRQQTLCH
jgi:hypothetical protein